MHRADVRDHQDVGPGERRQPLDLAEAAHRQLADAHLGVGLDPAERQRDADLRVVVALVGDRAAVWAAQRVEDVLG